MFSLGFRSRYIVQLSFNSPSNRLRVHPCARFGPCAGARKSELPRFSCRSYAIGCVHICRIAAVNIYSHSNVWWPRPYTAPQNSPPQASNINAPFPRSYSLPLLPPRPVLITSIEPIHTCGSPTIQKNRWVRLRFEGCKRY